MPRYNQIARLSDMQSGHGPKKAKDPSDFRREVQQAARSSAELTMKRAAPDRIVESRCHCCQHTNRDFIEYMLIRGMPYKTLGDRVSPKVDRRSIANHHRNHMDLQDAAFRAILEAEAQIQGLNHDEGVQDIITKRSVLEIAMRMGFDDVLNGVTTVEPKDLIQMIKVLAEMDSEQQQVGLDEARAQVQIFLQAIRDVCTPEIQNAIGERVGQLRKRENIESTYERLIEPPIDAMVVEEPEFVEA